MPTQSSIQSHERGVRLSSDGALFSIITVGIVITLSMCLLWRKGKTCCQGTLSIINICPIVETQVKKFNLLILKSNLFINRRKDIFCKLWCEQNYEEHIFYNQYRSLLKVALKTPLNVSYSLVRDGWAFRRSRTMQMWSISSIENIWELDRLIFCV